MREDHHDESVTSTAWRVKPTGARQVDRVPITRLLKHRVVRFCNGRTENARAASPQRATDAGFKLSDAAAFSGHCTFRVRVIDWDVLPTLAVTVSLYVPAAVPVAELDDGPPPHPPKETTSGRNTRMRYAKAKRGCIRFRNESISMRAIADARAKGHGVKGVGFLHGIPTL